MIAEILPLQVFDLLVLIHLEAERPLHNLIGQDGECHTGRSTSVFPFIGQILPDGDPPQPLVIPLFGVALLRSLQYLLGLLLSVRTSTMSITANHHSPS